VNEVTVAIDFKKGEILDTKKYPLDLQFKDYIFTIDHYDEDFHGLYVKIDEEKT